MNKYEIIRKLSATVAAPVVRLDAKWVKAGSWPKALRKRAKASLRFLLTKRDLVLADDLTVEFLAERTGTMTIEGPDRCERWAIISIYYPNVRYRYAVRCTAWAKRPPFPGLSLTDREVELVYMMCDELSRRKSYTDDSFDIEYELSDNISENVQTAQELGDFDEQRFLALLERDSLALPVLEAALLSAVWTSPDMEHLPAFLLNFVLPNAQSETVREGVDEHFHAVDLLRSPDAPFERVFTFRFENASLPVYPLSAAGRMIVLEPVGDPARKALADAITAVSHIRHNTGDAADRPLPAFPVTVAARPFPSHLAYNVEVPKDVHALTDAEADLLRLAAAKLLRHVPTVVWELSNAFADLNSRPGAYRYRFPDEWSSLARHYIGYKLFQSASHLAEFRSLIEQVSREEHEQEINRIAAIDKAVEFVLTPSRYANVTSEKPMSAEELKGTIVFQAVHKREPVMAFVPERFEALLRRVDGSVAVDAVLEALKNRGIISHRTENIRVGSEAKRFHVIPLKKCRSSSVSAVTGGCDDA